LGPSQVGEGEEGERGGVPEGKVPTIAGKVGLGDDSLGTSKEGSNLQLTGHIKASCGTT